MARTKTLQDSRFRIIWALLLWEGGFGNARLRQLLPVESVMVSRLIAAFLEAYPDAAYREQKTRLYRPTGRVPAGFERPSIDEYLSWVRISPDATPWIEEGPAFRPAEDPKMFAALQAACAHGGAVAVVYASMTKPGGAHRTLFPHALARVGGRWIVRSWCTQRRGYIDMRLDRFSSVEAASLAKPDLPRDELWEETVDLRLRAHSKLPADFASLVERYRFGGAGSARQRVRKALVPYILQDLRAALDPDIELPPAFELEVVNTPQIAPLRFPGLALQGGD